VPLRKGKAVRKRRLSLKLRQSWKVILFVLFLCAIGCAAAAYVALKFPP